MGTPRSDLLYSQHRKHHLLGTYSCLHLVQTYFAVWTASYGLEVIVPAASGLAVK